MPEKKKFGCPHCGCPVAGRDVVEHQGITIFDDDGEGGIKVRTVGEIKHPSPRILPGYTCLRCGVVFVHPVEVS